MSVRANAAAIIASAEGAESASENSEPSPTAGVASGADSASAALEPGDAAGDPADGGPNPVATTHAILEEKLRRLREENQARGIGRKARAEKEAARREREEAARDREAAAAEKQRWESMKSGSWLDAVKAAGRDPREVFLEFQQEAIREGTPEAMVDRYRSEMERQLKETVEPLQKRIDEYEKERKYNEARGQYQALAQRFNQVVVEDDYEGLRDEYEPDVLFAMAHSFVQSPDRFYAAAERLRVRLQTPAKGFTMPDILNVLKAQQDAHEAAKATRRAAKTATHESQPDERLGNASPTVNGTTVRRNAGPIGNDLASSKASSSAKPPVEGTSASDRIRRRAKALAQGG